MIKNAVILGSTGSIGTQAADVMRMHNIKPVVLTANTDVKTLEKQCREFMPRYCVVSDKKYNEMKTLLADTSVEVRAGRESLCAAAAEKCDCVLNAIVGAAGLMPSICAIEAKNTLALANKETMVTYGSYVTGKAKENGVDIIPVDSEHSAIYQCLNGENKKNVKNLLLTASGGPFFGKTKKELENVTVEQALNHPKWSMGRKITIDSATMMNKGLEIIEAAHLFDMPQDRIKVLIHRESIVHSMVEYDDGCVKAQLSCPDMRLCIQYAFSRPERLPSPINALELCGKDLTFRAPDDETFPLMKLARLAYDRGGNACAAINGANEAAVERFLNGEIAFPKISEFIHLAYDNLTFIKNPTLEDIEQTDREARVFVRNLNGGTN